MAVVVRKNGRTLFQHGYGVRDLRTLSPIDAQTDFRLASCTKQFTAMAIMLLIHDGKLRYDETLTEIFSPARTTGSNRPVRFPGFPPYGRKITVRHLLTHTSGLPDYETLMQAAEKTNGQTWTPDHQIQDAQVLSLLEQQSAGKFEPGTSWDYSNSGFVVLGLIVARVSGEPYGRFLHERIFEPLHMRETLAYVDGTNQVPNRAYGFTKESAKFVETDQSPTSATLGDGGVYSNIDDLAKWDDALAAHTLLSEQDMKPALTPVKLHDGAEPHWPAERGDDNLNPGRPVSYGFGWFLDPYQGHVRTWHSGGTMGFRTVIDRFTGDKLTIIILGNRTDLDPSKLALQVADVLLNNH